MNNDTSQPTSTGYGEQYLHDGPVVLVCERCAALVARDLEGPDPYDAGLRTHNRWHDQLERRDTDQER